MTIREFEDGKIRIMAEARDALRKIGVDEHCVVFDLHSAQPHPKGAALTVTADGNSVSSWFSAEEIQDSRNQTSRPDVAKKISTLVAGLKEAVAG
jgi:hypothetical protein